MFSVRCPIFQTPSADTLQILDDVVVVVDGDTIISVLDAVDFDGTPDRVLGPDTVLVPGFIDLHIHAPQWPQLGTGYDVPLDEWLFPVSYTHLTLPTKA